MSDQNADPTPDELQADAETVVALLQAYHGGDELAFGYLLDLAPDLRPLVALLVGVADGLAAGNVEDYQRRVRAWCPGDPLPWEVAR